MLEVIHAEDVEVKRVIVHAAHTKIFKLSDRLKKFSDWNRGIEFHQSSKKIDSTTSEKASK